jgi:Mrp family chromosome partitioning ATPase
LAKPGDRPVEIAGSIPSGVDNLWLLPSGNAPANPGELFGSDRLGQTVERLEQLWDIIVFDAAPVGAVADTLLLAHNVSGCLVVARAGHTRRASLRGALAALRGQDRLSLGVVLNDERPGALARFRRDNYYHHGYWSGVLPLELENGTDGWHNGNGYMQYPPLQRTHVADQYSDQY